MPAWAVWTTVGVLVWLLLTVVVLRVFGLARAFDESQADEHELSDVAQAGETLEPVVVPGRRRILVVDDDPGLRLLLRTTLTADEFAVEEAVSAEEAAEIGRFWSPAVVILDVGLPGVDGFTFCRELKENPAYGAPLIVLLTGQETTSDEIRRASCRERV